MALYTHTYMFQLGYFIPQFLSNTFHPDSRHYHENIIRTETVTRPLFRTLAAGFAIHHRNLDIYLICTSHHACHISSFKGAWINHTYSRNLLSCDTYEFAPSGLWIPAGTCTMQAGRPHQECGSTPSGRKRSSAGDTAAVIRTSTAKDIHCPIDAMPDTLLDLAQMDVFWKLKETWFSSRSYSFYTKWVQIAFYTFLQKLGICAYN